MKKTPRLITKVRIRIKNDWARSNPVPCSQNILTESISFISTELSLFRERVEAFGDAFEHVLYFQYFIL